MNLAQIFATILQGNSHRSIIIVGWHNCYHSLTLDASCGGLGMCIELGATGYDSIER